VYKSLDLWYYFLVSNLQQNDAYQPVNYAYLSGALQGGMQMIARELVMVGLLQHDDLAKAEEIVATMITRCEASEREFSNILK
jgi:hypothetical protein